MKDEEKIETWLAAFYNGETTPEEEAVLADFFNSGEVDEKFKADSDLFNALYEPNHIPLPAGLSLRLEATIDKHITDSTTYKSIHKTKKLYISILSAAAAVLLFFSLFFFQQSRSKQDFIADTYSNPEEAAIMAEQTLLFISAKLNQGLSPLEKVQESVKKTNEILNDI